MDKKKSYIHNQLKDLRLDENLTQSDLALLLEIENIWRILELENNKPNISSAPQRTCTQN